MRVLVCGGRDYNDAEAIFAALDDFDDDTPVTEIIQGGAKGADSWAKLWAKSACVPCRTFAANWKRDGRKAGPIRNERMLVVGKPDVVIAFPGGRGTADCVRRARDFGIRVIEVHA